MRSFQDIWRKTLERVPFIQKLQESTNKLEAAAKNGLIYDLRQNQRNVLMALAAIAEEDLWIPYLEESYNNSPGGLVVHICGNLEQYILNGIPQKPDTRKRKAEFTARTKMNKEDLKKLLNETVEASISALNLFTVNDLTKDVRIQVFKKAGLDAAFASVSHFSQHTGQIVQMGKTAKQSKLDLYDEKKLNGET